jgi:hypothetical protein
MNRHWSFSAILLGVYVAVFHAWTYSGRDAVLVSGVLASALLTGGMVYAAHGGYFANRWDAFAHAMVILDILIECLAIRIHEGHGYLLCAAAFAVVLGSYRRMLLRRNGFFASLQPVAVRTGQGAGGRR